MRSSLANQNKSSAEDQQEQNIKLTSYLQTLHSIQDTLPKLIDDEGIHEQKIYDYYVELKMVEDNAGQSTTQSQRGTNSNKPSSISTSKIFTNLNPLPNDPESSQDPKKVLITGIAGAGKSTMLNYIAYQWGTG
jgi:predicted NACHT family NTPase